MVKNKKGFTLIEMLAAITILGILTSIAIVAVTKIIENGKKEHYVTAEANLVLAGQSYVQSNRTALPKAIGQKTKVSLKTLVEKNYINKIKDYSDNECDQEKSYVQIYKYSQSDYSYLAYLECPKYNSEETINKYKPEISVEIIKDEEKSSATAEIKIDGNDKLMSYSYIIYKGTKEVKNTGSISTKNNREKVNLTIPLTEYTPGKIKIAVTATNTYGNTTTKATSNNIEDLNAPKCIIKDEDTSDKPKEWITTSRKITIGCDDGEGSGCTRETYSKTFKSTTKNGIITIADESGNTTKCVVSVYVDKTKPSCTKDGDSTSWTNSDRTISYGCDDGEGSGCDSNYTGGSKKFTTSTTTATIDSYIIKDKAGNQTSCTARTANVYVDKDPPTKPIISLVYNDGSGNYDQQWTKKDVKQVQSSSDSHSGGIYYQYTHDKKGIGSMSKDWVINWDGKWTFYVKACDKVGNCSGWSDGYNIKRDTTPPTAIVVSKCKGTNIDGVSGKITRTLLNINDKGSGVGYKMRWQIGGVQQDNYLYKDGNLQDVEARLYSSQQDYDLTAFEICDKLNNCSDGGITTIQVRYSNLSSCS